MRRSSSNGPPRAEKKAEKKPEKKRQTELKVPMPDPVTEQVILAAALVDGKTRKILCTVLTADHFFAEGHPEAWGVVVELERRGLSYDPATVKQLGGEKFDAAYLDTLVEQRPAVPPNLQHHLDLLRWNRARVEAIRGPVGGLVDALADLKSEPQKVVSLARAATAALEGHASMKYLRDPHRLIREQMEDIRKRRSGLACYPFGLSGFDQYADGPLEGQWRIVPGAAPGEMTVITGVPGSGKTTVTARLAVEQANQQRRVLYGAWEQGAGLSLELCASISLEMSRTKLSTGQIDDAQEAAIEAEMERLSEYIRFFDVPFDRGLSDPDVKKWELNNKHLDVIFEYLVANSPDFAIFDLWRRALGDFDPDAEERALYRQQAMLQATKCHGVLIHQLKAKDIETREDKTPTREALKGSSAWFEVPDNIFGVHREFLWKAVPDDVVKIVVLKQRKGVWPLAVDFPWNADTGFLGDGRSAEYVRPGTKGAIDALDGFTGGDIIPASAAAMKERAKQRGGSNGKRKRL
jgi:KaiC/GvpD/RAD55 family RecA-like ATPase